jgi:hypothetical protein
MTLGFPRSDTRNVVAADDDVERQLRPFQTRRAVDFQATIP